MIGDPEHDYRVGIGTDIHRLVEGRKLMLGGIYVPFPAGLAGHSDGDAVIHAVIDALLGAAGLGDIGTMFPDSEPAYKNIDSKELLYIVKEQLESKGWKIVNVDLTVHAEEPRLEKFKGQMKRCISGLIGVNFADVNVKAKTNEGLDDIGSGQAISATAIALLMRRRKRTL